MIGEDHFHTFLGATWLTEPSHNNMLHPLAFFSIGAPLVEEAPRVYVRTVSNHGMQSCVSLNSPRSTLCGDSAIPNVILNNGVEMPMISLGTWQYSPSVAQSTVELGFKVGFNHIDTANDYRNQKGVGAALPANRTSYFLTTKVPSQTSASTAYQATTTDLNDDLSELGLTYVDL